MLQAAIFGFKPTTADDETAFEKMVRGYHMTVVENLDTRRWAVRLDGDLIGVGYVTLVGALAFAEEAP